MIFEEQEKNNEAKKTIENARKKKYKTNRRKETGIS